jgi:activator of HSP90 ATPase
MDSFELTFTFPVSAHKVYKAWLNSEMHSAFTGSMAAIQEEIGSRFTSWDGYITGMILELEEDKRILQSWRTADFPMDQDDSMVEIELSDQGSGCKLRLKHWNIPTKQGAQYLKGWDDFYFQPMLKYFSS